MWHRMNARCTAASVALLAVLVTGCDPFEVLNPGPIGDESLDLPEAGPVVLVGIVGAVEVSADAFAYFGGVASSDLTSDATRPWVQNPGEGRLEPEDGQFNWDLGASARWIAERGIERLEASQPDPQTSPLVAGAYLWAGYANRILGDNVCVAVFDGGAPQSVDEHYRRAIQHFTKAQDMAQAIGASLDTLRLAAIAGLAQANLILGNYAEARNFAQQIPDDFLWVAHRSDNSGREFNQIWLETHQQRQVTVYGTYSDSLGPTGDPRTPWEAVAGLGASGTKPFHRQLKYAARGSDIPLAKGAEMRLIEAEVELRNGQISNAMSIINDVRSDAGVAAVTANDSASAWVALDRERHLVLWLEGRRLKDNARFSNPPLSQFSVSFMQGRDSCFPPSRTEADSNPNIP